MDIEVRAIDPHDDGALAAHHAVSVAATRAHDRVRLIGEAVAALPGGPPRDEAGAAFAAVMGAKEALVEVRRRLDMSTVDTSAPAAAEAPGYSIVYWREHTPEGFLSRVGRVDGRPGPDAPTGDPVGEAPPVGAPPVRAAGGGHARRGPPREPAG